jgi:G:T-mismatch repair DNA endonuclease (very short patch repair protein)
MAKCPYCKEKYSRLGRHAPYCDQKPGDVSKDEAKIESIKARSDVELNEEKLIKWYYEDESSLTDISNKTGLSVGLVSNLFDLYGLEKRSLSEGSKKAVDKFEKTCEEKYGVSNPSKLDWVKEKKEETFLENYGVDNIFKSEDFCEWLDEYMLEEYGKRRITDPEKSKETKLDRYGEAAYNGTKEEIENTYKEKYGCSRSEYHNKIWETKTEEEKKKHIEKIKEGLDDNDPFSSSLEDRVANFFDDIGVEYQRQFFVARKSYDFRIESTPLIIEINGDYWHANPEIYEAKDLLNYPEKQVEAEQIWQRDVQKIELAESYGYDVCVIWEKEINEDSEAAKTKLKNLTKTYGS